MTNDKEAMGLITDDNPAAASGFDAGAGAAAAMRRRGRRGARASVAVASVALLVALGLLVGDMRSSGKARVATDAPHSVSGAVVSDDVQIPLPASGIVTAQGRATLMPAPASDTPTVTSAAALATAEGQIGGSATSYQAVLARVTVPGTEPVSGSSAFSSANAIDNRLCWVVVFTAPKPVTMHYGGHPSDAGVTDNSTVVGHMNELIDASTGKFLMAFFSG